MAMNAVSISRADAFGGFDVLESRVRRFEYAPHRHAEVVIAAYTAGRKLARCEKQEFGIGPGDLLVIGPETLHAAATVDDAGWHYQSIYLQMEQIAEATGQAIRDAGLNRVALFGTRPVMQLDYLKTRWGDRFGIETITPTDAEQEEIDRIIFDELVKGDFRDASRRRYIEIAERMRADEQVEGLILGCTEIFLLIDQPDMPDFPMFNTASLHCDAAVRFALEAE